MASINSQINGVASGVARTYSHIPVDSGARVHYSSNYQQTLVNNICRSARGTIFVAYLKDGDAINEASIFIIESEDDGLTWSTPELVLEDLGSQEDFEKVNIVCDRNEVLHMIAYNNDQSAGGQVDPESIFEMTRVATGGSWSSPSIIDTESASFQRMTAVGGKDDEIWIVIRKNSTPDIVIYHFDGASWDSGTETFGPTVSADEVDISIDKDGNAHILWNKDTAGGGDIGLYYANSFDGPWESRLIVNEASGVGAASSRPHMTITPNDKIHFIYPSGTAPESTNDPLVYSHFDIPSSGQAPTVTTPIEIIGDIGISHQSVAMISADLSNRIYITTFDDQPAPDEMLVLMSTNEDYDTFITNSKQFPSFIPTAIIGKLSAIYPKRLGVTTNMPRVGMFTTLLDTNTAHTPADPDFLCAFFDNDIVFDEIQVDINSEIDGYLFAAQDDQFIDGVTFGLDVVNTFISGFIHGCDFIASPVSGFIDGVGFTSSSIFGVLLPIFGDINSTIDGIVSQDTFTSQIFGFQGSPDINDSRDGYLFAANDDQFIDAFIAQESGINDSIDAFVKGGAFFFNQPISGVIFGNLLFNDQINGFALGDEIFFNDVDGFIFGVSGIINDQINGFIRAAFDDEINGFIFGVSGIINDDIDGIIIGDEFITDNVRGLIRGFIPPISPDQDCFID